jgi:hypothetical protein
MANPEYFAKFGQFIHWYANVERIVHYVFRHFSGLPQEAARTIDGGMNLSALVSLIRRIIVARKVSQTDRNELECLFDHLGHITVLRDTLIHRGGESIGENVISTNYHVARSETDFEYIELNLKDIQDAMLDCTQMYMRFEQLMEAGSLLPETGSQLTASSGWQDSNLHVHYFVTGRVALRSAVRSHIPRT